MRGRAGGGGGGNAMAEVGEMKVPSFNSKQQLT